jgi:hypothetical protein
MRVPALRLDMEEFVEQRLDAMLAEPLDRLRSLPEYVEEEVVLDEKKTKVTTYHETLEGGKHRLIIQAIRERWGGIAAKVIAGGYEFSDAGSPRKLRADELYDYT